MISEDTPVGQICSLCGQVKLSTIQTMSIDYMAHLMKNHWEVIQVIHEAEIDPSDHSKYEKARELIERSQGKPF